MSQEAAFVTKGSHIYCKDSTLKMDVATVASPPVKFRICCSLIFLRDSTCEDPTRKLRILHWSYSSLTRQLYCKSITFVMFFFFSYSAILHTRNHCICKSGSLLQKVCRFNALHFSGQQASYVSYKLTKVILGCASDPVKSRVGLETTIQQNAGNTSDCCRYNRVFIFAVCQIEKNEVTFTGTSHLFPVVSAYHAPLSFQVCDCAGF